MKEEGEEIETGLMNIVIKDDDFLETDDEAIVFELAGKVEEEDERKEKYLEELRNLLPKKVAEKIAARVPDGFTLSRITFNGEVSGKPFGIGVSGNIEVVFERETL